MLIIIFYFFNSPKTLLHSIFTQRLFQSFKHFARNAHTGAIVKVSADVCVFKRADIPNRVHSFHYAFGRFEETNKSEISSRNV